MHAWLFLDCNSRLCEFVDMTMCQEQRQLQQCVASHVPSVLFSTNQLDNLNEDCLDWESMAIEEQDAHQLLDQDAHAENKASNDDANRRHVVQDV